jgi:methylglutaconyl-CoA hydratase
MSFLKVDKDNGVYQITFNRPELHNAFNDAFIKELTELFKEIETDDSARLVTLSGEGKSFSAGADLNWMKSMVEYSEQENIADSKKLALMFEQINNCPVPVVGFINGHALGGGVGLVSVCDYVMASDKALFGFTEVRLGLIPAVISPYVISKIGESHARAWFLSGERFSAHKAFHTGLVHTVVSPAEFESKKQETIQSFLKAGPVATRHCKELINNVLTNSEPMDYTCQQIAIRRVSAEGQEGMKALLNKEKPSWQ